MYTLSLLEGGEMVPLTGNAALIQGLFEILDRRQSGLGQAYLAAVLQHEGDAKGEIPTSIQAQLGDFIKPYCCMVFPGKPLNFLCIQVDPRGRVAPDIPKRWAGWQGKEQQNPGHHPKQAPHQPEGNEPAAERQTQRQTARAALECIGGCRGGTSPAAGFCEDLLRHSECG